jgi:hypothetical protein
MFSSSMPGWLKPNDRIPRPRSPATFQLSGCVAAIHIGGCGFSIGLGPLAVERPTGTGHREVVCRVANELRGLRGVAKC